MYVGNNSVEIAPVTGAMPRPKKTARIRKSPMRSELRTWKSPNALMAAAMP